MKYIFCFLLSFIFLFSTGYCQSGQKHHVYPEIHNKSKAHNYTTNESQPYSSQAFSHLRKSEEYKNVSWTEYFYNSPTDSIPRYFVHEHYENDKLLKRTENDWDEELEKWLKKDQEEWFYDNNGYDSLYIRHRYDNDQGTWIEYEKAIKKYDPNGNRLLASYFDFDPNKNQLLETYRVENVFDASGNLLSSNEFHAYETGILQPYHKSEKQYNELGNLTSWEWYYWFDEIDSWHGWGNIKSSYDSNGNLITETIHLWDDASASWYFYRKKLYSFDQSGNNTVKTTLAWDSLSGDWLASLKNIFTYNDSGKINIDSVFEWNMNANDWVLQSKFEYEYHISGMFTIIQYNQDSLYQTMIPFEEIYHLKDFEHNSLYYAQYSWDDQAGKWIGIYKLENAYDELKDGTVFSAYYEWSETLDDWIILGAQETIRKRDENGNLLSEEGYELSPDTNNEWIITYKYEYHYNENKEMLLRSYFDIWRNNNILKLISRRFYYYNNESVTDIDNSRDNRILIYPNPVDSYLYFSGNDNPLLLKIYNLNGVLVRKINVLNQQTNIFSLPNALYILHIYEDNILIDTKRVLKK